MSLGWVEVAWVVSEAAVVVDGLDPVVEGDLLASVLLGGLALDLEDEVGAVV